MPIIYGVDLGAHSVKVAELEGSFGRYQIKAHHAVPVPQSVEEEPDLGRRLAVLGDLIAGLGEERSLVSAAYPAESASVRLVRLPFGDRAQVEKTLRFEVEDLVPFDVDETSLAHRILSVRPDGSDVLVALAPREAVRARIDALKGLNLDPSSLCVDSDLIGHYADSGVQAVVDIGHRRTLVTVAVDGKVQMSRALTLGGRALTLALARARGLSWDEAEARKHGADIAPGDGPAPSAEAVWEEEEHTEPRGHQPLVTKDDDAVVLLRALRPLLNNMRATLISFEDTLRVEIDEILLCGGGAALGGLREHLQEEMGVPIRKVYVHDDVSGEQALAHTLGLRAAKMTSGAALDMRQGDLGFQGDLVSLGNALRIGALAAAVMLVVGVGWFGYRYSQLSADLSEIEDQITAEVKATFPDLPDSVAGDPTTALAVVNEETAAATQRVESLGSILSDTPPTLSMLRRVSEGVPAHGDARLDVEELTITRSSITFEAETDSYEDATEIEAALQRVAGFSGAKKGDENKNRQDKIDFKITIPLDTDDDGEEG